MSLIIHCLLILTVVSPFVLCNQSHLSITIDQIISTLTRALNFFSSNVNQVNLDAGIGTRIVADQLHYYTKHKRGKSVKKLVDLSEYVTWKIAQSVRYRQADYYQQLSFLLMPGTFSNLQPFRFHNYQQKMYNNEQQSCSSIPFYEKLSDQCLNALGFGKCNETETCNILFSDQYACRYSLTHQIFSSIIAKRSTCQHQYRLSSSNEYRMVSRMFHESQMIAKKNFPETDRDLFMEQIVFGGLLGWKEFFQDSSWFNAIISWQHPIQGCYGNDTNSIRNKREEMQMLHECLSHRTSVATAALSQILRYMLSRDI